MQNHSIYKLEFIRKRGLHSHFLPLIHMNIAGFTAMNHVNASILDLFLEQNTKEIKNDPNWKNRLIDKAPLNKSLFELSLPLLGVRIPGKLVQRIRDILKSVLFSMPRIKSVLPANNDGKTMCESEDRLILLNPQQKDPDAIEALLGGKEGLEKYRASIVAYTLKIGYDAWSAEELLKLVLPDDIPIVTSFETAGHIAHLNLRPEHMPFKSVIGQIIMDKNPNILTVVTKTCEIQNVFRVFPMEVIAGDHQLQVQVKQNGCIFEFDYGKVYWNSRLEHEHARLVEVFKPGERIADVFAGIGPFSIPAAKKGCFVYANDLNPSSYEALCNNKSKNRISERYLETFNMDGKNFIRDSQALYLNSIVKNSTNTPRIDHYIMNLPASAPQFLRYFRGITSSESPLPMIHCYLFSKNKQDPVEIIKEGLGWVCSDGPLLDLNCHNVRNVAPGKEMYCVTFRLPFSIATSACTLADEAPLKKSKLDFPSLDRSDTEDV